ncbi:MAG: ATP-NAD kinase family protein [Candidatus Thermoplasmatota archaeon]|nr:ATP-NAD kinase family protein [Candidatus Thermoplasmatota archaeon]
MSLTVGFIINPIAGMGGRVGLKGTDGVVEEAIRRGACPISYDRAFEALSFFVSTYTDDDISWVTCAGDMGEKVLSQLHITKYSIVYTPKAQETNSKDTKKAIRMFLNENVDIILFTGGDGTARDIAMIVDKKIPILGIPSGVKMHSAVFGVNPVASAKMLHLFVQGGLRCADVEIMDLDEELYRLGEWKVRLYATALGLVEPQYIQVGKAMFSELSETEIKDELAEHLQDEMKDHNDTVYFFGAGGTIDYIAKKLGFENTVLGVDAVIRNKTIAKDVSEKDIMKFIDTYEKAKIVVSPIGAQGFIFGRGNLQFSPIVLKQIGFDNIIVVSTPAKIAATPLLRVDTGDAILDRRFIDMEMMMVVIGYRLFRVVRMQPQ